MDATERLKRHILTGKPAVERRILLARNPAVERWCRVVTSEDPHEGRANGSHIPLGFPASMKAGDVARAVAMTLPHSQIGILSDAFGPRVRAAYGEIVWLVPGFEKRTDSDLLRHAT